MQKETRATIEELRCPSWLETEAKEIWVELVPRLQQVSAITPADEIGVAALCQQIARWRQAEKEITEHGLLLKSGKLKITAKGVVPPSVRINPATRYADAALKQIKSLLVQFGLTPRARGSIKENVQEDAFDRFLRGE